MSVDALLNVFDFYADAVWHTLVHVRGKWRDVFGSQCRLNLRLYCTDCDRQNTNTVRETLDIWPPLPIVLMVHNVVQLTASLPHSSTTIAGFFTSIYRCEGSREFAPRITPALQELVRERANEVLPALQTFFYEDTVTFISRPVQEAIWAVRCRTTASSHSISISSWE